MADNLSAAINDDHPLALELASLRAAVARYQHEAYATSLKLQRHSLEAAQALDHARALERENTRLRDEITVLRDSPDTTPTETAFQVPELTLALRRLSDKLTAVEETLLERTKEVVDVRSELASAQHEIEAARALAAEARAREEEGLARERELERKVRATEEERRMADLVVQEYAALVRKLEGRSKAPSTPSSASSMDIQHSSNGSATTLADGLAEGKLGLQKLLEEFNGRHERLQSDIAKLHGDNGLLYKELEVARQGANHDRDELAKTLHELDTYRADDNTATKMVSRYMKFSQSSTDTLQKAIDTLKLRHASTLATLNAEITHLQRALSHERSESERIRTALDDLTEDIARETYGRRREVSLRLAFLGREENLAESLRRWVRKAQESLDRSGGSEDGSISLNPMALREAYAKATADAEALLEVLNGQPSEDDASVGSIARLVLAQDTVSSLTHELQEETIRRLKNERKLARIETVDHPADRDEYQDSHPVMHPFPHRMKDRHEERHLLDASVGTSASPTPPPPAHHEDPSEPTSSAGVHIIEVVTVPAIDRVPSVAPPESAAIPNIPSESSSMAPSIPTSVSPPVGRLDSVDLQASAEPLASQPSPITSNTVPVSEPSLTVEDSAPVPATESTAPESSLSATSIPFPGLSHEQSSGSVAAMSQEPPRTSRSHPPAPLPLEATGLALSSLSPTSQNGALPASDSKEISLLNALANVKNRYDGVQRGFRDCHLALQELKKSLADSAASTSSTPSDMSAILRRAVERLADFKEDARVELEIRIADEERIASGYEALLSIPGAMSHSDDAEKMDEDQLAKEVRAFVDGSDPAVAKATHQFTQKLDDLEHDIASIKRTLYELGAENGLSSAASAPSAKTTTSPSWSAWTPSFLSPPTRSTSPAPQTFGSVMTSPRLRHSSSFSHPRERSDDSSPDPLASLGLRIVVPVRSPTYGPGLSPSPNGGPRAGPRQRTTSGMFMLGLGMRSTSFGPGVGRQGLQKMPSKSSLASSSTTRLASTLNSGGSGLQKATETKDNNETEARGEPGADSDVE
ncbi:hypothetical protein L226DRAFT_609403 [Lentinus tigrinus ALCF2SS1-7]|uniref:Uncharacterized protein n=1 Tax=Lentinus tigrinus ALCF2SS1-6 TaxID=1328759 RepID=A0A5C2SSD4_9APHY|nr:hypothetical protein L227DRAFT_649285 [Lentinus tigrinus ALCF2SS1-6]RPD80529.1 hypothetical protein L226DRAFT_609403 [Lentinus tigrinus ALCF2SS1-7]